MNNQLLFTPEEAANQLRIGRSVLYLLLKSGRLDSVKVGRSRRIPTAALERLVADLAAEAQSNFDD
jgi:excisionase family DNA binding protein